MNYRSKIIYPGDGYFEDVVHTVPKWHDNIRLHILLFIATVLTTTIVGATMSGNNPFNGFRGFVSGFPFSLPLLGILGIHEFGHYFSARYWNIHVTLPYFIPAPFPPVGTFGAVIKMKSSIPNRKALVDVGASGPIVGFIAAVVVSLVGLSLSEVRTVTSVETGSFMMLGESLIFRFLGQLVIGTVPENADIFLHPIAFAGWLGLFVTALNLIPIGQLDGGHVLFSLSPRIHELLRKIRFPLLVLMGIAFWEGWYLWAVLSLLFGRNHPYPNRMEHTIGPARTALAITSLLIFVLCFTPTPISIQ